MTFYSPEISKMPFRSSPTEYYDHYTDQETTEKTT